MRAGSLGYIVSNASFFLEPAALVQTLATVQHPQTSDSLAKYRRDRVPLIKITAISQKSVGDRGNTPANWVTLQPLQNLIGALVWRKDWIEYVFDSSTADDQR